MWNLINSGYIHKYKYINKFIIMIQNKMKIKNNKISLKILFLRWNTLTLFKIKFFFIKISYIVDFLSKIFVFNCFFFYNYQ